MSALLDTTICIPLLNDLHGPVRSRYRELLLEGEPILVPSVVVFELWYGVARSSLQHSNRERLIKFLSRQITVIPLTESDCEAAGLIRAELERRKQPIGPIDTLIAGQAVARGLTLITHNVREFSRVDGLSWEDWT